MATTYERAPNGIQAMVEKVMETYHPELKEAHVSIDVTVARRETKKEGACHALKRSGYLIDAKIGITALADRARGIADAKLTIDAFEWDRMSDKRKASLIDHELEHLDVAQIKPTKRNDFTSGVKYDDLGRAVLKTRPHDWELTGFKDVAERHGSHSHEAAQFANFRAEYAQLNLFGGEVLAIAEGRNGKADNDHVKMSGPNGESIFEGTSKEFKEAAKRVSRGTKSKACKNRHHSSCHSDGCRCQCHSGAEARV